MVRNECRLLPMVSEIEESNDDKEEEKSKEDEDEKSEKSEEDEVEEDIAL